MRYALPVSACVVVFWTSLVWPGSAVAAAEYRITETIDVDVVPSWFPVRFCLLTHGSQQYAAYYNERHQLIVARRELGDPKWQKTPLPTKVGWDSHNYVTMAVDDEGFLHLSGNMHCVPLIYFRTRKAGDITAFERLPMTGQEEKRCTYPRFLTRSDGSVLFMYRSGSSGNGRRFYNSYDVKTRTWTRFLDTPLFEGEGRRNAYPLGPAKEEDGRYHVVWVWRDTPDCATNHHLSYARSRDLKHWEAGDGTPARLPLTLEQSALWVDPIPPGGGIINGCQSLVLDSRRRPVIAYHKSDENGHMQVCVARFEDGQWRRHPVTAWAKKITFGGGGAMPFIGITISDIKKLPPELFFIGYRHRDYGSGRIVLDEETLKPVERQVALTREYPRELLRPTITFPGIGVRLAKDLGGSADADTSYVLRWETLGAHHDRPRKAPLPPPSPLKLIKLLRHREPPCKDGKTGSSHAVRRTGNGGAGYPIYVSHPLSR